MNVHLPKGMVPEGWDVIGEGAPGVMEAAAVLMGWVALIIEMAIKMGVVKNRNEYRMPLRLVTCQVKGLELFAVYFLTNYSQWRSYHESFNTLGSNAGHSGV